MFSELVKHFPPLRYKIFMYTNILNPKRNLKCKRTCVELRRGQVSGCCGAHILFSSRLSLIFLPTMVSFDQSSLVGGGCAINVAWLIPDPVARSAPPCTPPTVY
ncbi:hypothetical protein DBV15_08778 [Temnothorax longispinosus]|uniref:Uncharacterized protein n=1 Tax=Temnothorax longispinosus TaxID=300112 RepID=A0A4S2KW26_9HYME|nr:hypothetical protein DBV15_08778 [Temnothorax longispinosus]